MKFLHIADLHVGKSLHERDLLTDQEAMLQLIVDIARVERPAAVLIAGDVYDRSIPPPGAVRAFSAFLAGLKEADPGMAIVIIPGNHDSPVRLSFGSEILALAGVHIRTDPARFTDPVLVERDGERASIYALPFLEAGAFESAPGEGLKGQAALFASAVASLKPEPEGRARILMAHVYAAGGSAGGSERGFLGQAEYVGPELFASFDYAALGHLHRHQRAGEKGWYPGSPLAYAFDESGSERGCIIADVVSGGASARFVPIKPIRPLRRLRGRLEDMLASEPGCGDEDYIEAVLTDLVPSSNPGDRLRSRFPNLLSIRQEALEIAYRPIMDTERPIERREGLPALLEDFTAFSSAAYGADRPAGLDEDFAPIAEEACHAAD